MEAEEQDLVLQAIDLHKTYGRRHVVDGVNLHVGTAEIVGLLGPNGAGKSTSFRMICGMVTPDRGRVYWMARMSLIGRCSSALAMGIWDICLRNRVCSGN